MATIKMKINFAYAIFYMWQKFEGREKNTLKLFTWSAEESLTYFLNRFFFFILFEEKIGAGCPCHIFIIIVVQFLVLSFG